jgi:hypothetical protein
MHCENAFIFTLLSYLLRVSVYICIYIHTSTYIWIYIIRICIYIYIYTNKHIHPYSPFFGTCCASLMSPTPISWNHIYIHVYKHRCSLIFTLLWYLLRIPDVPYTHVLEPGTLHYICIYPNVCIHIYTYMNSLVPVARPWCPLHPCPGTRDSPTERYRWT